MYITSTTPTKLLPRKLTAVSWQIVVGTGPFLGDMLISEGCNWSSQALPILLPQAITFRHPGGVHCFVLQGVQECVTWIFKTAQVNSIEAFPQCFLGQIIEMIRKWVAKNVTKKGISSKWNTLLCGSQWTCQKFQTITRIVPWCAIK